MKIESIRLKNFRMFRDVTINKLPNCCVFVGANGTGKTNFLDLFRFLRDSLTAYHKFFQLFTNHFIKVINHSTLIKLRNTMQNKHWKKDLLVV